MPTCSNCNGQGWVCENHPNVPWDDGDATCCAAEGAKWNCGAGAPCPKCNPADADTPPRLPDGARTIIDRDGYRH